METPTMIGRLRGILISKQPPWLVIDVGGVGYELEAPLSTIFDLPETGREVTLFTHYAVKEDTVALYGFLRESERSMFRALQKVSGIGAKTSLSVLSGATVDEFARLVHSGDIAALMRIPGIGKKTAERIVVELRDRVEALGAVSLPGFGNRAVPAGRGDAYGQGRGGRRRHGGGDHPQGAAGRTALNFLQTETTPNSLVMLSYS